MESAAIILALEQFDRGEWIHLSSEIAAIEVDSISDPERRARVRLLLPSGDFRLALTPEGFDRAEELGQWGFKPADALHVWSAEELLADVLLSCDDRLCRAALRHAKKLRVRVANPLDWMKEANDDTNS